jgi:hypothetical protein
MHADFHRRLISFGTVPITSLLVFGAALFALNNSKIPLRPALVGDFHASSGKVPSAAVSMPLHMGVQEAPGAVPLPPARPAALARKSAGRCTGAGATRRCESSFGHGTIVTFGDSTGNVDRLVIDAPDTSVDDKDLAIFIGITIKTLTPQLSRKDIDAAFKALLVMGAKQSAEHLRLGDWNWASVWRDDRHFTLTAQKRATF